MTTRQPNTRIELEQLIAREIEAHGPTCSLNHIDVSKIEDMSELFNDSLFNGDISQWNTSNVTDMDRMFQKSQFNGDISKWDTARVTEMGWMFCESQFNGDISQWNTSRIKYLENMSCMFQESQFTGDLRAWKKSDEALREMFTHSYDEYVRRRTVIEDRERLFDTFQTIASKKQVKTL